MANPGPSKQRRGLVAIDGAMAMIVVLLIVQIWLLSATLEAFLGGHKDAVLPAAIFSGLRGIESFCGPGGSRITGTVKNGGASDRPKNCQIGYSLLERRANPDLRM